MYIYFVKHVNDGATNDCLDIIMHITVLICDTNILNNFWVLYVKKTHQESIHISQNLWLHVRMISDFRSMQIQHSFSSLVPGVAVAKLK